MCNRETIGVISLEEKSFKNVDGQRTDTGCLYIFPFSLFYVNHGDGYVLAYAIT